MTPTFWKYLITTCNGSAVCLVAESDRDSVEKELESDPRLLSYHAKPQIECPSCSGSVPECCGVGSAEPTQLR